MAFEELDPRVAELALRLKHQFQAVVIALPNYGRDAHIAQEMAVLGDLIKELEDTVVMAQVRAAAGQG